MPRPVPSTVDYIEASTVANHGVRAQTSPGCKSSSCVLAAIAPTRCLRRRECRGEGNRKGCRRAGSSETRTVRASRGPRSRDGRGGAHRRTTGRRTPRTTAGVAGRADQRTTPDLRVGPQGAPCSRSTSGRRPPQATTTRWRSTHHVQQARTRETTRAPEPDRPGSRLGSMERAGMAIAVPARRDGIRRVVDPRVVVDDVEEAMSAEMASHGSILRNRAAGKRGS